jgi:demethylmenaquinone methyltransferase/2-methoxy-6-polyprenyl-1,4-benzoquinol methylase
MELEPAYKGPEADQIRTMFSKVAGRYDLANSVLSMGIHHLWRKKAVQMSGAKEGQSVLDCATGTGDLALEFKRAVGRSGRVVGTDFCAEMLHPAPAKSRASHLDVDFSVADVMNLPFADNSFDICSISFGIRNVQNPERALQEMARVTKTGGKVIVIEFGQSSVPGFAQVYNFYSEKVLPVLGGFVTGQRSAYNYLQKSSEKFPCREEFVALMKKAPALANIDFVSLTGGIAYIYRAEKR